MQKRCERNRKRSKRRAIFCPIHGCYLDSASQKYSLYADTVGQLQQRGVRRKEAMMLMANSAAICLDGEWLEAFWCDQCQSIEWYYVKKKERVYEISVAPAELWQRAIGVSHPEGNPSVGEFTRRHARMASYEVRR
ncbi:MAG: hypothetical protein IGS39_18190 [Calothrix sp. C42_A2020_038]|nr:hypothetical protein [Calothrix sp. C42_A2020_038]